jgi:thymidylate kinase
MRSRKIVHQGKSSALDGVDQSGGPGRILLGVFETLDRAEIPYCVLHGYEGYPQRITSDVDCIISARVHPDQLAALFHENRGISIDADLVCCREYQFVFAGRNADRSPCYLVLDLSIDYELGGLRFYTGREVIESRRRHNRFWIPAPQVEFGCYLARKIEKAQLNDEQGRRLNALYAQDPAGCKQQIPRFWGARNTAMIVSAASSGDWTPVRSCLSRLDAGMRMRAMLRHPWRSIGNWSRRMGRQVRSGFWPDGGLTVVFLGPDGVGKSSVIKAVPHGLAGAFARTTRYYFAPGLLSLFRRSASCPTQPHAAVPRSLTISVMRALCYWLLYYFICYRLAIHFALARSTLVLHDRHFLDALVDPKRYRYGGPTWLLRLIWRFTPKPDLVILLDAPPEVVQARKQEVPFEETALQREAYLSLIGTMRNGYVVDAARPLEQVVGEVKEIILRHLATRIARRFGLEQNVPSRRSGCKTSASTSNPVRLI